MRVRVLFYSFLRDLAGESEAWIDIPEGATLKQLIEEVGRKYGPDLGQAIKPQPGVDFSILIYAGGQDYRFAGGEDMRLVDRMDAYFIPPAAGG
ncbi:MAG: hypothetical protein D9V47_13370 [Clostridia bacterium]|nr:MAG: hypothetical protein D9V47_13370 [Clostridia bacterium]